MSDRQQHEDTPAAQPALDPARQSIRAMLVQLAQANGEQLRTLEACDNLMATGIYVTRRGASKSMFTVLARARDFRHEGPGLYRYVGLDPREGPPQEEPA